MPKKIGEYDILLGTFNDNEFTWHHVESYKDLQKAYKAFKEYVNSQLKYTDEELLKVWNTGRLDIELRKGNQLLNWVGIYSREVDRLMKKQDDEDEKDKKDDKKDDKAKAKDSAFERNMFTVPLEGGKRFFYADPGDYEINETSYHWIEATFNSWLLDEHEKEIEGGDLKITFEVTSVGKDSIKVRAIEFEFLGYTDDSFEKEAAEKLATPEIKGKFEREIEEHFFGSDDMTFFSVQDAADKEIPAGSLIKIKKEWLEEGERDIPYMVVEDRGDRVLVRELREYAKQPLLGTWVWSKDWIYVIDDKLMKDKA